jgi:diacylglycerol kinase (ATP)
MARSFRVFRRIFRFHGFFESLKIALNGIAYLFLYHRNMRIIFLCAITAFLMGIYFRLRGIELVALCITCTLVFMAEMFNTAIEMMIDMSTRKYHTLIKLVKDIAAAVVLIAAINSLGVGYVLFSKHILDLFK